MAYFITWFYVAICYNWCIWSAEVVVNKGVDIESADQHQGAASQEPSSSEPKLKQLILGEEALRISPAEPYCLCRPIRRGHLNISQHYPMQQVQIDFISFPIDEREVSVC